MSWMFAFSASLIVNADMDQVLSKNTVFLTDLNDFEILSSALNNTIVTGHFLTFPNTSRSRAGSNSTSSTVHHVTVTVRLSVVVVTLHVTLETFTLSGADDINPLAVLEKSSAGMTFFFVRKVRITCEAELLHALLSTSGALLFPFTSTTVTGIMQPFSASKTRVIPTFLPRIPSDMGLGSVVEN